MDIGCSRRARMRFSLWLLFALVCAFVAVPARDGRAVVLQDLLDGDSLRIGSWLLSDWNIDFQDEQIPGSVQDPRGSVLVREFEEVEVEGDERGIGFAVRFDLDEHYLVSGFSAADHLQFTVRSLNPAIGVVFADFDFSAFDYVLKGQRGGVRSGLLWWGDDFSPSAGYGLVALLDNGIIETDATTMGGSWDLILPFCPPDILRSICAAREMDLIFKMSVGAGEGSFVSILSTGFFVDGGPTAPVPEPATLGLFIIGLAGLGIVAQRRCRGLTRTHN